MSRKNPFLLPEPYDKNPFRVLEIDRKSNKAIINDRAQGREKLISQGRQPVPELELQLGDCIMAAEALQDPVLRLAFDLMHFGIFKPGEKA